METRICKYCGEEKEVSEFWSTRQCLACHKIKRKAYNEKYSKSKNALAYGKKYRQSPGYRLHIKAYRQSDKYKSYMKSYMRSYHSKEENKRRESNYYKRRVTEISDAYVRRILINDFFIPKTEISPELIQLERMAIINFRNKQNQRQLAQLTKE